MPTKSAFKSKTVWGAAVAGLSALLNLFGINIGDLTPELTEQIFNAVSLGGTLVAIYGRVRARTIIAPKDPELYPAILLAACLGLGGLTGCENMSPEQKAQMAALSSSAVTIGTNVINAALNVGLAQASAAIAPHSDDPYLASVALGLRTLQGTEFISSAQVQDIVATFGDPNEKDKFAALGGKVGKIVTGYGSKVVTDAALEAAATALNQLNAAAEKLQAQSGTP